MDDTRIEDLINVSHGIDFILDAWTKDFQTLGKTDIMGWSWMICCDCVLQQRTDCCMHKRYRELFKQAARERIGLPSVARGYLIVERRSSWT